MHFCDWHAKSFYIEYCSDFMTLTLNTGPSELGDGALYYRKWKLTIWHRKKEIPDYLEEMEE